MNESRRPPSGRPAGERFEHLPQAVVRRSWAQFGTDLPAAGTLRGLTDALLAREAVTPRVVAECDSLEVVRALVASGFGSALLPRVASRATPG